MRVAIDNLGKVAITIEESPWSETKDYRQLTIVLVADTYRTYISRKPVPAGTSLSNTKYWLPFSSLKEDIVINYNNFKAQVQEKLNRLGGIIVSNLPTATQDTVGALYLKRVGINQGTPIYEKYITLVNGSTYTWLSLGTTEAIEPVSTADDMWMNRRLFIEVFADAACTTKPQSGITYTTLYLKFYRNYVVKDPEEPEREEANYSKNGTNYLYIVNENDEQSNLPMLYVTYLIDYFNDVYDDINIGDVIAVNCNPEYASGFTGYTKFYSDGSMTGYID